MKAVRERCEKDQTDLKTLTRQYETLLKSSGNCSNELADCKNQKSYLEFLKQGYDIVVQELETEAKDAKADKKRSDKDADDAIKGEIFIIHYRLSSLEWTVNISSD